MKINLRHIETVTISDTSNMKLYFIKKVSDGFIFRSNHCLTCVAISENELERELRRYIPDPMSTVHINGMKLANDFVEEFIKG